MKNPCLEKIFPPLGPIWLMYTSTTGCLWSEGSDNISRRETTFAIQLYLKKGVDKVWSQKIGAA